MYTKAFKGKGELQIEASQAAKDLLELRQRMKDFSAEVGRRRAPFFAVVSSQSARVKNLRFNRGAKFSVRWRLRNSNKMLKHSDMSPLLDSMAPGVRNYWIGLIEESLWLNMQDVRLGTAAALLVDLLDRIDQVEGI
jgi:hypothetical protein